MDLLSPLAACHANQVAAVGVATAALWKPGKHIDSVQGIRHRCGPSMHERFDVDLSNRPMMITVRGYCQKKDGRIHTDMAAKVVTALLYLNDEWDAPGGRLRFLRGPDDLDDAIAEVPPDGGTLVAFRRSDCSWHGHAPCTGERRG